MGMFSNMSKTKTNQGGVYFKPGNYTVELKAVKLVQARSGVTMFIVETTVVTSDNLELPPGTSPSQVISLKTDNLETHLGNVKSFIASAMGVSNPDSYVPPEAAHLPDGPDLDAAKDAYWERAILFITDEATNPLKGYQMMLNCVNIETRAGRPYTKHVWGAVVSTPENSA